MKEYILTCPNALKVPAKGLVISTQFAYTDLDDALRHKAMCDDFDISQGVKPKSYIQEVESRGI